MVVNAIDAVLRDMTHAFRALRKSPSFSATVLTTLALGIGINSAIFGILQDVLLRPLPYSDPDRLVMVSETAARVPLEPVSLPNFLDWRLHNQAFASLSAQANWLPELSGDGDAERLVGQSVTADLFSTLGVRPLLGRVFDEAEQQLGQHQVVILSHGLWVRHFGSDPNIVGRAVTLNELSYRVVGVLQKEFRPTVERSRDGQPEIWAPLLLRTDQSQRRADYLQVIGRLRLGLSLEQAQADMQRVGNLLAARYPEANQAYRPNVVDLQSAIAGGLRRPLWVLFAAVTILLLIACINIGSLLLARGVARQGEFALRSALGGTQIHLFRQIIIEGLVLSGAGTFLGVLVAAWVLPMILSAAATFMPSGGGIRIGGPVFLYAAVLAVGTGAFFSMIPSYWISRLDLQDVLKDMSRGSVGSARRGGIGAALVVAEVALALILLSCASLLLRSFWKLESVDLGFRTANLITADVTLPRFKSPNDYRPYAFLLEVLSRLEQLPGVEASGASSGVPLSGRDPEYSFWIEGEQDLATGLVQDTIVLSVTPGYLSAVGIPLLSGRPIALTDRSEAPNVCLISQALAKRYFPSQSAIGHRITFNTRAGRWFEIVGVVGDVRHRDLAIAPGSHIYTSLAQRPTGQVSIAVRTRGSPTEVRTALPMVARAVDSNRAISRIRTGEQIIDGAVAQRKFILLLLVVFALSAVALAGVGIYGVLSYSVAQRTAEIGVRTALGASSWTLIWMFVGQSLKLAFSGIAIGTVVALTIARSIAALLFGVTPTDPATFGMVILGIGLLALAASYVPVRRALRVSPVAALRM